MTIRNTNNRPERRDHGFTLVEMLTVIVIIGILAAFTAYGSITARNVIRRGIVVADIKQVETGLQELKTKVGELPPDFAFCDLPPSDPRGVAARARVVRYLRNAYPKMQLPGANDEAKFAAFLVALPDAANPSGDWTAGPGPNQLNPSTALTFWLGGIPNSEGIPSGFHEDETNPFKLGEPRSKPYFQAFKKERLNGLQLLQPNIRPAAPYVYFRGVRNNATGRFEYGAIDPNGDFTPYKYAMSNDNFCVPYLEDASTIFDPAGGADPVAPGDLRGWREPQGYQIIAAGLDGVFSSLDDPATPPRDFRVSKMGIAFTQGDFDNLANFAKGELEDELLK